MESLTTSLLPPPSISISAPSSTTTSLPLRCRSRRRLTITCAVVPDPWTPKDGIHLKPRQKNPKNPLSDDNARRIIKSKARYLSALRGNQGSAVQTPRWIRRSPEQMVQYLEDDRNGHLYGKHVVAAVRTVRALSQRAKGSYDMREAMASFVAKLTFREMCVVLKEQKGWMQVRDFFAWMKLQRNHPLPFPSSPYPVPPSPSKHGTGEPLSAPPSTSSTTPEQPRSPPPPPPTPLSTSTTTPPPPKRPSDAGSSRTAPFPRFARITFGPRSLPSCDELRRASDELRLREPLGDL